MPSPRRAARPSAARCRCAGSGAQPAVRPIRARCARRSWPTAGMSRPARRRPTHCGGFFASAEPGKMAKRAPRAPANSVSAALPGSWLLVGVLHPDVRQQAGQQRYVHPVRDIRREAGPGLRGLARGAAFGPRGDAQVPGGLPELRAEVLPFPHPQVVQVLAAAHAAERRARQRALLLAQVVPQPEEGEEVRSRLGEAARAWRPPPRGIPRAVPWDPEWTAPRR